MLLLFEDSLPSLAAADMLLKLLTLPLQAVALTKSSYGDWLGGIRPTSSSYSSNPRVVNGRLPASARTPARHSRDNIDEVNIKWSDSAGARTQLPQARQRSHASSLFTGEDEHWEESQERASC